MRVRGQASVWVPHHLASAMLLIRLDASGLGHAKRLSVFASILRIAPRCEAAGKPCKAGKAVKHPNLALRQPCTRRKSPAYLLS